MTVTGQPVVNYDYYDNGWIENIRQIVSGTEQKFNFVYDDGGRRTFLKYFKGGAPTPVTETIYQFNTANMLENIQHLQGVNILENLTYSYDANGNRTNMNRPSVTLSLPNPASNTSYNSANQMLSFNDKNIVYDNNGNMTSVTNTCGTTNYTWDVRNRLAGINGFKPDCSSLSAGFKYDALGRRIEKTINGTTTQYLYDGLDIIQEINQDGSVKANYIRGLNIDEPLLRITQNAVRFYMTDALGSVIALTDETGVIKTTYTYDPFGNTTVSGESSDNPFQYTGRENDGTGLYGYRERYYSPELQRFISEDPIGLAGGDVNLYVMVGNNPVNWIDPWGLAEITYDRSDGRIYVTPYWSTIPLLIFPAGNNTTNPTGDPFTPGSHGPSPSGTFTMGNYIPTGNDPNSAFGIGFIPINLTANPPLRPRTGVGLHSGRANRGGPNARTHGCIRTTDDAMRYLQNDPPTVITIQN